MQGNRHLQRVVASARGDIVFGQGQHAPGTNEGRRLLDHELTNGVQSSVVMRDNDDDHPTTRQRLDECLTRWNVPEEDVITLLGQLNQLERWAVLSEEYRDRIASALNVSEMVRAVNALDRAANTPNFPLTDKLEWVNAAALSTRLIDYSDIRGMITSAPQHERDDLRNDEWQGFFVQVCTNETMAELVDALGGTLQEKLSWMQAEGSSWPLVRAKIEAPTDETQKTDLYDSSDMQRFFVRICNNAEMAEAVILLGGTWAQRQAWLDAEGTSIDEYLDAIVRLRIFVSGSVAHTAAIDADEAIADHLGALVADARGDGRQIAGIVAVVADEDWDVAGINRYGESVWAGGKRDSINGFVDVEGRVWIHRDRGNPGTMIHEACHKWSDDALQAVSQPLNEGVTEYFTRRVCAAMTPSLAPGRANYQANWTAVNQLVALVGEATVAAAFFDGDVDGLREAFVSSKSETEWNDFITATRGNNWAQATTLATP
jgi:hypothetical protein